MQLLLFLLLHSNAAQSVAVGGFSSLFPKLRQDSFRLMMVETVHALPHHRPRPCIRRRPLHVAAFPYWTSDLGLRLLKLQSVYVKVNVKEIINRGLCQKETTRR